MYDLKKRFLAGLLTLVMAVSLLPVQAFTLEPEEEPDAGLETVRESAPEPAEAEEAPEGVPETPDLPYCLLVTHSLDVDGETYGKTEMLPLAEEDFWDGVYDIHDAVLDREGMTAVKASYVDTEEGGLVESWTVGKDAFEIGGDPEDGSAYYAVQMLIEYEVAAGYKAEPSDVPYVPGEYDAMALAQFTGSLNEVAIKGVDIITLTLKFEYSRTGGLFGVAAADTVKVEVPVTRDNEGNVTAVGTDGKVEHAITAKDGFRMLVNPYPLNQFVVDPVLATDMTRNPDPDRIAEALEGGSFSVVPERVYKNGTSAQNGYTSLYDAAWDLSRISAPVTDQEFNAIADHWGISSENRGVLKGYLQDSVARNYYHATVTGDKSNPGAASVGTAPKLTVTITPTQAMSILELQSKAAQTGLAADKQALEDATTVTVYYRRNATSYTVKHWVKTDVLPDGFSNEFTGTETGTGELAGYTKVYAESLQGRVGALTNAQESPVTDKFDFAPYKAEGFSQQEIRFRDPDNAADEGTVVNIKYVGADEYRVIFNTNYTYIPRQLVKINNVLNITGVEGYKAPTRTGYTFAGWRYRVRSEGSGAYQDQEDQNWYVDVTDNKLTLTAELIRQAVITQAEEGDGGIKSLSLYPKWTSGEANVRVVLWVEDLTGADDVQVSVTDQNNSTYWEGIDQTYKNAIVPGGGNAAYSNMGSFTFRAQTDTKLSLSASETGGATTALTGSFTGGTENVTVNGGTAQPLSAAVQAQFQTAMGTVATSKESVQAAQFYHPARVTYSNESGTVANDGSTVVNVYYNRNIYALDFTYYGLRNNTPWIAANTNGFAQANNPDPDASGRYGANDYTDGNSTNNRPNRFVQTNGSAASFTVARRVTIQAKYGADIRDVWPVATGETVGINSNGTAVLISWTTTTGPYNANYNEHPASSECTLMGVYAAMGADIIAAPGTPGTTHHLYAYWADHGYASYYRYNHCFEVPTLDASTIKDQQGVIPHSIYNNDTSNVKNVLYLVPISMVPQFGDLLRVNADGNADTSGGYYAVRVYDGNCYALARQVNAVSDNYIAAQNPSARLHLTRVENPVTVGSVTYQTAPDHSTEKNDSDGASRSGHDGHVGSSGSPYDLYFYYTREKYTITYMAPINRENSTETEVTLGTRQVSYGTILEEGEYKVTFSSTGEDPDYKRKNTDSAFSGKWTAASETPVCPDRSDQGTKPWNFGGWYLNRACTNAMEWNQPISSNFRIYAKWTNDGYTVTFDWGAGTPTNVTTPEDIAKLKTQTISANTRFSAAGQIPRPVWKDHVLKKWVVDGTENEFDFDAAVTKDVEVEAVWEEVVKNTYAYTVRYLWKLPADYTKKPGDSAEYVTNPTGLESGEYLVLGEETNSNARYPENTTLWLTAKTIEGYTPVDANKSVVLTAGANELNFPYTKNETKNYAIHFATPGGESNPVLTEDKNGVAVPSDSITSDALTRLNSMGYQLAKQENGVYVAATDISAAVKLTEEAGKSVTYAVIPITYTISYGTAGVEGSVKTAADTAVASITGVEAHPGEVKNGKNPVRYDVEDRFTLQNPGYIQDSATKEWYRFNGWTLGDGTSEANPTAGSFNASNLLVEHSVGDLQFNATWARVTDGETLKVSKTVRQASGVPAPENDSFSFTVTPPAGGTLVPADILAYTSGTGAEGNPAATPTYAAGNASVTFTLKAGQTLNLVGLAAGTYTVKENTDGNQSTKFDSTRATYYSVVDANPKTVTVGGTAAFVNEYHASVTLDLDPDAPGIQSFQVIKHRVNPDGTHNAFIGGNHYSFTITKGEGNEDANTPLPKTDTNITLNSIPSAQELKGFFGEIMFTRTGTYRYLIREDRPRAIDMVPGVTYDPTVYRAVVTVEAQDSDLVVTDVTLQTRQAEGTFEDVTPRPESVLNSVIFDNVYDPAATTIHFTGRKELKGRTNQDGTNHGADRNEFQFRLTAEGSYAMTAEDSAEFHTKKNGGDADVMKTYLMGKAYTPDESQPMPAETENVKIEVLNGKKTAVAGNGEGGRFNFGENGTTFGRASLGANVLGKVYHYTVQEIVPDGYTVKNGKKVFRGVEYDDEVRDLFVYVHLHGSDGAPLTSGATDDNVAGVVLNADVSGVRDSTFTNIYTTTPVIVDLGGDPDDPNPGPNTTTASIIKNISGRTFTANDTFTFTLTPENADTPMPLDGAGNRLATASATISPTSGSSARVPFGKITFNTPGTYKYTLQETAGSLSNMTYDTAVKTLTITVSDDGTGKLSAAVSSVSWTNTYKKPSTPTPTPGGSSGGHHSGGYSKPSTPAKLDTSDHFAYILGKSDGLVHPEANITRAEVATIFYRLLTEDSRRELWTRENPYPDVPSSMWCNIAVSVMSNAGVIKGRVNGKFDPYANITRGEFAAIAARFLSEPYEGEDYYADISTHWAREYINRAAAAGWVKNFDRPFRPNDKITRAEVMSLVNAMIGRAPDKDHMHEDMIQWPDNMDTTQWYYEDVQEATNSHEYVRIKGAREDWTKILPVRDWNAIEKEWANLYDAVNPGDVTDISKRG